MKFKIQNGAVEICGNTILECINFEIKDNEHIAIVGKNGSGKTTLINAIIDNDILSQGTADIPFEIIKIGKFKIGYLQQISINEDLCLFDELISSYEDILRLEQKIILLENNLIDNKSILEYANAIEEYKILGGYSYKKDIEVMISKFGFKYEDKLRKIGSFSGGEKMKISFMKLLLLKPDLLLLDEPTNHLDITTIEWLEDYLKRYKKAFIVISHDRMFLDNIVDIVYDIDYGETIKYNGNYSKYVNLKKERYNKMLKDYEFQQSEIKRLNNLYERFRYKPTKAKMALSKLKQIERMTLIDKPNKEKLKTFNTNLKNIPKPGKIVLSIKNIEFGYDKPLGKLNLEIEKGKKIGIIGINGSGKSTLLKTLSKIINPLSGSITYGYNVKTAYFDQNLTFETNGNIIEEFSSKYPELLNNEVRNALGSFLFSGEDVNKPISVLSGGEKVRLLLCETFYSNPNLMFLDEPTNHLDIIGKGKLENSLKEYPGTIIFVSHDRYFVKELADELLVFENNEIKHYKYGYEEYINKRNFSKKEKEVMEKTSINILDKIDKEIDSLNKQIEILNNELYREEVYNDYKKVNEINLMIENLKNKLALKEREWEDLID